MSLATSLQRVASQLITKFGGAVTIRRIGTGIYNPTTGTVSESDAEVSIRGVVQGVSSRSVNDLVRATDKLLLIAATDVNFKPLTSDEVIIGGVTHQVIDVQTIEQDNIAITYELVLRS
jgi:hypothetical protein